MSFRIHNTNGTTTPLSSSLRSGSFTVHGGQYPASTGETAETTWLPGRWELQDNMLTLKMKFMVNYNRDNPVTSLPHVPVHTLLWLPFLVKNTDDFLSVTGRLMGAFPYDSTIRPMLGWVQQDDQQHVRLFIPTDEFNGVYEYTLTINYEVRDGVTSPDNPYDNSLERIEQTPTPQQMEVPTPSPEEVPIPSPEDIPEEVPTPSTEEPTVAPEGV